MAYESVPASVLLPESIPWLPQMMEHNLQVKVNPFLHKLILVMDFITGMGTLAKTHIFPHSFSLRNTHCSTLIGSHILTLSYTHNYSHFSWNYILTVLPAHTPSYLNEHTILFVPVNVWFGVHGLKCRIVVSVYVLESIIEWCVPLIIWHRMTTDM